MSERGINPRTPKDVRREVKSIMETWSPDFTGEPETALGRKLDKLTLGLSRRVRKRIERVRAKAFLEMVFRASNTDRTISK